jgi:hypothetical protein
MSRLETKVNFYEGQVDPLLSDNVALREHLLGVSRMVSGTS